MRRRRSSSVESQRTARVILRDLVNVTVGFEQLAKTTDVPSKSSRYEAAEDSVTHGPKPRRGSAL
jgi:hypothetical protein